MKDGTFRIFDDMVVNNFQDPSEGWSASLVVPKGAKTVEFRAMVSGTAAVPIPGKSLMCCTRRLLNSGLPAKWSDLKPVAPLETGTHGSKEWTPREPVQPKPIPIEELGLTPRETYEFEFIPDGPGIVLRGVKISFED